MWTIFKGSTFLVILRECNYNCGRLIEGINAMTTSIEESWQRICNWLEKNAPRILANLNAGASAAELQDAESALAIGIPDDWRTLYRCHNGMSDAGNLGSLFFGMQFAPLKRVIEEQSLASSENSGTVAVRSADDGIRPVDMHNPKWILLAHDFGDTQLRVDLDPGVGGRAGQVIFTDHAFETVILVASSISEMLSNFAEDLDRGSYYLNKEALAEGNQFLSCAPEVDIVNWSFSPRWKHHSQ
jgi:cell wall assembly regulator SMI1